MAAVRLPANVTKSDDIERVVLWRDLPNWAKAVESELKSPDRKIPVVVYLHGCRGLGYTGADINSGAIKYIHFLVSEGWAVFAPDSFARPGRSRLCYQQWGSDTYNQRREETAYALARLSSMPWVDGKRLVLAGHSEGGEAWSEPGFSAVVITGADCGGTGYAAQAPRGIPVLSLVGGDAPKEHRACDVTGRGPGSKSAVIPGIGHIVFDSETAKDEIRRFLRNCCQG